jgi:hypothetical protein
MELKSLDERYRFDKRQILIASNSGNVTPVTETVCRNVQYSGQRWGETNLEGQPLSLPCILSFREVPMSSHRFIVGSILLAFAACLALACGSSSRKLQSITVSPASADAQNYPNGKVPFVATGYYNSSPTTVSALQADWGAVLFQSENGTMVPTNGAVLVDTNGVAHCGPNASGTYSIAASVQLPYSGPAPPCPAPMYSNMAWCPNVVGTALLTCP